MLNNSLNVDKILTNLSIKYRAEGELAREVFNVVPVVRDSGKYRVWDRNFHVQETLKGAKAGAKIHDSSATLASFNCDYHALKDLVADRQVEEFEGGSLRVGLMQDLNDAIVRKMDYEFCSLFTTTNWSLNVTLAATWASNTVSTDPILVISSACGTVIANSGYMPNVGLCDWSLYTAIRNHQSVRDLIKYTSKDYGPVAIAGLLGLEKIVASKKLRDTKNEGETAVMAAMMDNTKFFLGYRPNSVGMEIACAGAVFQRKDMAVKAWRDEEIGGEWIQVEQAYDIAPVATLAAYLITAA